MIKDAIRYLVLSDIHLGHPRNKTEDIINALNTFFENFTLDLNIDILFLAGDVFDSLLDFASVESNLATIWIAGLMKYCGKMQIKLRVLKGTPSHDWEQSEIFNTLLKAAKFHVDMRYINSLWIEHMDDLDIDILYVPDEWRSDPNITYDEIKVLMAERNIKKTDIAIMHGNFHYQLPPQATKIPRHDEQSYLNIVKYFISIGHVHTSTVYSRILAQGSFDRLTHGEEEPKGGMLCVIYKAGHGEYYFIENRQAKIFKTIKLKSLNVDQCISQIEKATAKIQSDSYVRIKAKKDHPLMIGIDAVKQRFPLFNISKISTDEEPDSFTLIDTDIAALAYTPIMITQENIVDLMMTEIKTKYDFSAHQLTLAEQHLLEVI